MKTEECFELKERDFYRGTFKTKKAALKYLEEHFKNRNDDSKGEQREKRCEQVEKYVEKQICLVGWHKAP